MRRMEIICACVAGLVRTHAWVVPAGAQLTAAQKCEKLKNKGAGKRVLCVAVQRGKEIAGKPSNYAACTAAMSAAFATYETDALGACPTTGDAADVEARIDDIFNPSKAIPKALSAVRFIDNLDGTVTNTQTGPM